MKCPRCQSEIPVYPSIVGYDSKGNPIAKNFAYCQNCNVQYDLTVPPTKKDSVLSCVACVFAGVSILLPMI